MSAAILRSPFDRVNTHHGFTVHLRAVGTRTTLCGKPSWALLAPTGSVDCAKCAERAQVRLARLQAEAKAPSALDAEALDDLIADLSRLRADGHAHRGNFLPTRLRALAAEIEAAE